MNWMHLCIEKGVGLMEGYILFLNFFAVVKEFKNEDDVQKDSFCTPVYATVGMGCCSHRS